MVAANRGLGYRVRFPLSVLCSGGLALLTIDACGSRKIAGGPDGGGSGGIVVEGTGGAPGTGTGAAGGSLEGSGGTMGGGGGGTMGGSGGSPTGAGGSSVAGGTGGAMGAGGVGGGGAGGTGGNACVPTCTVGAQQCVSGFWPFVCSKDASGCPRWESCPPPMSCFCDGPEVPVCRPNARLCVHNQPQVCIVGFFGAPAWKPVIKCGGPDEVCTTNPPTCCSNDPECSGDETYCRAGERFFGLCVPDAHGCFKATPAVFPFPDSQTCR